MHLSPDQVVFWRHGPIRLSATLVYTWGLMLFLVAGSRLITMRLARHTRPSRWQILLEILVTGMEQQIAAVGLTQPRRYLGFLGTLFVFVATANLFTIVPGYEPPTSSLSTTAALALCVWAAVPVFGIADQGLAAT